MCHETNDKAVQCVPSSDVDADDVFQGNRQTRKHKTVSLYAYTIARKVYATDLCVWLGLGYGLDHERSVDDLL